MIIKESDKREHDLAELNSLLMLPYISQDQRKQIEREIRNIQAGLKVEQEAAYQINFHYKNNANWAILHDLRFEFNGDAAQIDHLMINRFFEIYVCESKRFGEGIAINEYGEFSAFYQGKPYGIASPLEQNNRHKLLLKRLFKSDEIELPMRMGMKIVPSLHSLILVANSAIIQRPKNSENKRELERIIKNEQIAKRIDKDIFDNHPSTLIQQAASCFKLVSSKTITEFAKKLASLHKPLKVDWKARFGIVDPIEQPEVKTASIVQNHTKQEQHLFCASCKKSVTANVAKFCWQNKVKFHGKVYCFNCQKNIKQ